MDWENELSTLLEEQNITLIVKYLMASPQEIPAIIELTKKSNEKIAWRAAWVLDHLNMHRPEVTHPYLPELLQILKETDFNGVRRSLLKIIINSSSKINEDGELLDLCFQWTISPAIPIAVRAHGMQYIYNLLPKYPELENEFIISLEATREDASKGIQSKARKILSALRKTKK